MVPQEDIEKQVALLARIHRFTLGIGDQAGSCRSWNVDQVTSEFEIELFDLGSFLVKIKEGMFNGLGITVRRFVRVVCFVDAQFRGLYEFPQLVLVGPVVVRSYSSDELRKNIETVPEDSQRGFVQ